MSKAVLMSIRPQWCELIAAGWKNLELRTTFPKMGGPFTIYIYQTRGKWSYAALRQAGRQSLADKLTAGAGAVVGECVCDRIYRLDIGADGRLFSTIGVDHRIYMNDIGACACVEEAAIRAYMEKKKQLYGLHLLNPTIYEKAKLLNENGYWSNSGKVVIRPPQSWMYVKERTRTDS